MSALKSIAIYDEEQLEAYETAVETLRREGKLPDDASESDKIAIIAREATRAHTDSTEHNAGTAPVSGDVAELLLGLVEVFVLISVVVGGLIVGVAWLFGVPLPV